MLAMIICAFIGLALAVEMMFLMTRSTDRSQSLPKEAMESLFQPFWVFDGVGMYELVVILITGSILVVLSIQKLVTVTPATDFRALTVTISLQSCFLLSKFTIQAFSSSSFAISSALCRAVWLGYLAVYTHFPRVQYKEAILACLLATVIGLDWHYCGTSLQSFFSKDEITSAVEVFTFSLATYLTVFEENIPSCCFQTIAAQLFLLLSYALHSKEGNAFHIASIILRLAAPVMFSVEFNAARFNNNKSKVYSAVSVCAIWVIVFMVVGSDVGCKEHAGKLLASYESKDFHSWTVASHLILILAFALLFGCIVLVYTVLSLQLSSITRVLPTYLKTLLMTFIPVPTLIDNFAQRQQFRLIFAQVVSICSIFIAFCFFLLWMLDSAIQLNFVVYILIVITAGAGFYYSLSLTDGSLSDLLRLLCTSVLNLGLLLIADTRTTECQLFMYGYALAMLLIVLLLIAHLLGYRGRAAAMLVEGDGDGGGRDANEAEDTSDKIVVEATEEEEQDERHQSRNVEDKSTTFGESNTNIIPLSELTEQPNDIRDDTSLTSEEGSRQFLDGGLFPSNLRQTGINLPLNWSNEDEDSNA